MEKQFSLYLTKIGLLDKSSISGLINFNDGNINNSFIDNSFNFLMNYFDNLTEEQKKYMSYYIPLKFKLISEKVKKDKIKSIII